FKISLPFSDGLWLTEAAISTRMRTAATRGGRCDQARPSNAAQGGAAVGVAQFAAPFVVTARAADEIRLGLNDPLTGTYAELGKNERIGCELALEQIKAKGGMLGRKAELLVEDSTSADTGTAVHKATKLIDPGQRIPDFLR